MEKNKGITLIALIVTIIVLLILAGVAIITLSGNNGIILKATTAKERTERAAIEEQIDTAIISIRAEKLSEGTRENLTDVINQLIADGIIENEEAVNKKNGAITVKNSKYVIEGKLNDYILSEKELKEIWNLLKTTSDNMDNIKNALDQVKEIFTRVENGEPPEPLQNEINALLELIKAKSDLEINGIKTLNGTYKIEINKANLNLSLEIANMTAEGLDINNVSVNKTGIELLNDKDKVDVAIIKVETEIQKIDSAIEKIVSTLPPK